LLSFLLLLSRRFFFLNTFRSISLCLSADSALDSHGSPASKHCCSILILESESSAFGSSVGAVSPEIAEDENEIVRFVDVETVSGVCVEDVFCFSLSSVDSFVAFSVRLSPPFVLSRLLPYVISSGLIFNLFVSVLVSAKSSSGS
jgi:hypothetical protein